VNPDGSLDFTPPFDRPYDWTASGDPRLLARRFDFLTPTPATRGQDFTPTVSAPGSATSFSTAAVDLNGDGKIGDENGDGKIDEADRKLLPPTDLVERAHRHGLLVHTWTFRNEPKRLAANYQANPVSEILMFFELGVDGILHGLHGHRASSRARCSCWRTDREFGGVAVASSRRLPLGVRRSIG